MREQDKIMKMAKEGKISAQQADVLTKALAESDQRHQRLLSQAHERKLSRQNNVRGVLGIGVTLLVLALGLFVLAGLSGSMSRGEKRALRYFAQADIYLEKGDYAEAAKVYQRGIKAAPKFSVGYSLLGLAQRAQYQTTQAPEILSASQKSLGQARALSEAKQGGQKMDMAAVLFLMVFGVLVLSVVSIVFLLLYNILVGKEERVNESWAQVATLCQQKTDMVPALLDAVKGYAGHEQETLTAVIQARNDAGTALADPETDGLRSEGVVKVDAAQKVLSAGLDKIKLLVEKYPQLKADTGYVTLQKQIEDIEQRITRARQRYNKCVRSYNAGLRLFPMNLMAAVFKFESRIYYQTQVS